VLVEIEGRLGIAAFVAGNAALTVRDVLASVGSRLPSTMSPDKVFLVDEFPMTSVGKVDQRALMAAVGCRAWRDRAPCVPHRQKESAG